MIQFSNCRNIACPKNILGTIITFSICLKVHGGGLAKRADLSTPITDGASLARTSISALSYRGPNRNVVIQITNYLNHSITGGYYYIEKGWKTAILRSPYVIGKRTREAAKFEKVGFTPTGTSGMMSYTLNDEAGPLSFVLIWSVPFNYLHSSNWFGLSFIADGTPMNSRLYSELFRDPGWNHRGRRTDRKFGYASDRKPLEITKRDYVVSATMSNNGRSIIHLDIFKRTRDHASQMFSNYAKRHRKFLGMRF